MQLKAGNTAIIDHEIDEFQAMELCEKKMVFYGANTCWWTADPKDLHKHPTAGLPCDPRGGMLMQTKERDGMTFIKSALAVPEHYGKHGIRAFLLAYHGCVKVKETGLATCFATWDEYNQLIDQAEARRIFEKRADAEDKQDITILPADGNEGEL